MEKKKIGKIVLARKLGSDIIELQRKPGKSMGGKLNEQR